MKKIIVILVFITISIFTFIIVVEKDNNVVTVNNTYEFESDIINVVVQSLLKEANQTNFKLKDKNLLLLSYDTKFHVIDRLSKFKFDFLVYKRYLAAYELVNENNESIYILFIIPEYAIKNNLYSHQLPYIFKDAEKDGFYILIVSDSTITKKMKSIYNYGEKDFLVKFKEKEEISNKKILVLLNYFNKEKL